MPLLGGRTFRPSGLEELIGDLADEFHGPQGSFLAEGLEGGLAVRVVNIGAPRAADLPGLCDRLRDALEEGETELVDCDASRLAAPDAAAVDALARLQLGVRRRGARVRLLDASPELRQLIALMGLSEVMPCVVGRSGLEAGRQTEEREEPRGVEEERDLADPIS